MRHREYEYRIIEYTDRRGTTYTPQVRSKRFFWGPWAGINTQAGEPFFKTTHRPHALRVIELHAETVREQGPPRVEFTPVFVDAHGCAHEARDGGDR